MTLLKKIDNFTEKTHLCCVRMELSGKNLPDLRPSAASVDQNTMKEIFRAFLTRTIPHPVAARRSSESSRFPDFKTCKKTAPVCVSFDTHRDFSVLFYRAKMPLIGAFVLVFTFPGFSRRRITLSPRLAYI